jgi:hypothetical protein
MAKRFPRTPLYEVLARHRERASRPAEGAAPPRDERASEHPSTARTIRVPLGYVFLAAAGVIILIAVAYMIGHERGEQVARAVFEQEILDATRMANSGSVVRDPLAEGSEPMEGDEATVPGGGEPAESPAADEVAAPADGARGWGPINSDPRQPGLNYRVLATTRPDGARRLAAYCRENGLEAYVVGDDNSRLRQVIVLPGFERLPTPSNPNPLAERLVRTVERIGERWKAEHRGESDLKDAYWDLYEG